MSTEHSAKGLSLEVYEVLYRESIEDSELFWSRHAKEYLSWSKMFTKARTVDGDDEDVSWFADGTLNITHNCIDRHVASGDGAKVAYYWEGNDSEKQIITYAMLQSEVCKLASALRKLGVEKGDRVCIYMPMIPEAIYAMLATARLGAVHTVVFAGFSAEALRSRIKDCGAKVLVTAQTSRRGEKTINLEERVMAVRDEVSSVVMVGEKTAEQEGVHLYSELVAHEPEWITPVETLSTDPLFILYTSGSTGKPKGVLHSVGGYALYASMTHKFAFDMQPEDVYWCAADIGWITGHSYVVYGPLCNKTTSVIFEGVPTYPSASRTWEIIDAYNVSIYYSTPTLLRSLMSYGDELLKTTSRASLRVLGTVGEPINPEVWEWYAHKVGNGTCHIVDTWWQTETGGHAILSFVRNGQQKPGCAQYPFFGIEPKILSEEGVVEEGECTGALVLAGDWPGKLRGLYNDAARFKSAYLEKFPGYYFTGDGAHRDADGQYWITGRVDDVLNVSGRLIGTAEVESALLLSSDIAEAAVVDEPHPIKGSQIVAFVVPMKHVLEGQITTDVLKGLVSTHVGSFAKPDRFFVVTDLPKTRSGKIMRRILKKLLLGEFDSLGDISTLANPEIVHDINEQVKYQSATQS